ncbi:hypothetical protein MMC25_001113 [Agyrium rufum]|nr:hypothetical protein [Agyrium rufum]
MPSKTVKKSKSMPRLLQRSRSKSIRSQTPSIPSSDAIPPLKHSFTSPIPASPPVSSPIFRSNSEATPSDHLPEDLLGDFDWQLTKAADFWPLGADTFSSDTTMTVTPHSKHHHHPSHASNSKVRHERAATHTKRPSDSQPINRAMYGLGMHPPETPSPPAAALISRERAIPALPRPAKTPSKTNSSSRPSSSTHHTPSPRKPSSEPPIPPIPVSQGGTARYAEDTEGVVYKKCFGSDDWVPYHASPRNPRVRGSRSGLSTGSSLIDNNSTKHSSIFTKMSSVSDMTSDFDFDIPSKHASMTVDDAIDLYSAGFDDESKSQKNERGRSRSSEIKRRSHRITEAMNDSIDDVFLQLPDLTTQQTPDQNAVPMKTLDVPLSPYSEPPALTLPTATRDQYGFKKTTRDVNVDQYDAWNSAYAESQTRRSAKWVMYMKASGLPTHRPERFPERTAKTQRFIRKGLPPAWRGQAWFFYAGGDAYLQKHPNLYSHLVNLSDTRALSETDKESIERDVNRTFPNSIHFKPDRQSHVSTDETALLCSLRRVLCAFAIHHPRIGYCQSLNFIAGLLLLFLPEEKAFWMLHIITTEYLPGTHELSLEGANIDLWVLMLALKEVIPAIWPKIGGGEEAGSSAARLPPISLCTTSWFMSLFIDTLPIESVLRTWDILFYEGSRTLFRVAIAVFKLGEQEIRKVNDPMEIFQVVQGLPRKMLDVGAVLDMAFRGKGVVTQGWVAKKRAERKEWYAQQRWSGKLASESGASSSENKENEDGEGREGRKLERKITRGRSQSVWKSRKSGKDRS